MLFEQAQADVSLAQYLSQGPYDDRRQETRTYRTAELTADRTAVELEDFNQLSVTNSILPLPSTAGRRRRDVVSVVSSVLGRDRRDSDPPSEAPNPKKHLLGTFSGVYLPCVSNILGVIIFVRLRYIFSNRFSWIVGVGGISSALLIAVMSTFLTFLTVLSMSAIASNGKVAAGGAYFMVSRSLGKEFGGSVGILFALANTVGGVLYILGVVEIITVSHFSDLRIERHCS